MNDASTRGRALVGWLPLFCFTVAVALIWGIFLGGGFRSIQAFLALLTIVPLVSLIVAIWAIVRAIRTRRVTRRFLATAVIGTFGLWPILWNVGVAAIPFPYHLATTAPSAAIRVPTDRPMRVVWGGDDLKHNHHAMFPDQRWAYDLVIEPALGGTARFEDYGCWDTPVVAPTTGVVHVAHDGERDQTPGTVSNEIAKPLGNHVVIALDSGAFLLVAHLKNGSVVAREGESIAEGAPIGRCGNSGNTSEPHVHVHVQRQDPKNRPVNYSEGLPLFFRDHDGSPMPNGGMDVVGDRAVATGAIIQHAGAKTGASPTSSR